MTQSYDVAVVGAGPAGLIAALAMQKAGFKTVCVGPAPDPTHPDMRTTAFLQGSVHFLQGLGIWEKFQPHAAAMAGLNLIDRTGRLFRVPDLAFHASEVGETTFGHNIPNTAILNALIAELEATFHPTAGVTAITPGATETRLSLAEGETITAKLVVGADGIHSLCRDAVGVGVKSWSYDQTAIVCNFRHTRPHNDTCTEFHYPTGPFTVVPLPGDWSALIWTVRPAEATRLGNISDTQLAQEIGARLDGLLGDVVDVSARGAYPLAGLIAKRLAGERVAFVSHAAHVMPPIGAQGLNLGIRDIADLVRVVSQSKEDPGACGVMKNYERARRMDVWVRTLAVDLLGRTLTSGFVPLQVARGAGLMALSISKPLRQALMRYSMAA
jgi:2-octaprenyl-6-methoxyphenol hydroxylase